MFLPALTPSPVGMAEAGMARASDASAAIAQTASVLIFLRVPGFSNRALVGIVFSLPSFRSWFHSNDLLWRRARHPPHGRTLGSPFAVRGGGRLPGAVRPPPTRRVDRPPPAGVGPAEGVFPPVGCSPGPPPASKTAG